MTPAAEWVVAALVLVALLCAPRAGRWLNAALWRERCECVQGMYLCRRWRHHPGRHSTGWHAAPGAGRMIVKWSLRLRIVRHVDGAR